MMASVPRVLIVGAGIAGLTLANALNRYGVRPVLVESASTLQPPGLGLSLQPNGVRALRHIGLADAVIAGSVPSSQMVVTDADEHVLRTLDLSAAGPTIGIHRDALVGALTSGLVADIRLGTTVVDLEILGREARASLSDGTTEVVDLVVGADGLRSTLRGRLFPNAAFEYRGYRAWRTVVPRMAEDSDDSVVRWAADAGFGTFRSPRR
jgi:2-polyprenyl-6-methoxyphenol hydroxylase-like FAD-dependent oxidoreductase